MDIVIEATWALLLVGVPMALFTLVIVWWAMRNGHFLDIKSSKELKRELKAMSKQKVKSAIDNRGLINKKWAKFGGGFYGVAAFFTYIVIEATEIVTTVVNFGGLWGFLKQLDIGVILNIFIEALINFIAAMAWPLYWMGRIDTEQTWMWFVAAYAGYWLGLRLAQQLKPRRLVP